MPASQRNICNLVVQFRESLGVSVNSPDSEDIETVFSERPCFVEDKDIGLTSDVDSIRRDTENTSLSQSVDSERRPDGKASGKCGRYHCTKNW